MDVVDALLNPHIKIKFHLSSFVGISSFFFILTHTPKVTYESRCVSLKKTREICDRCQMFLFMDQTEKQHKF